MNYLTGAETTASGPILWLVARWLNATERTTYQAIAESLRPASVVPGADNALRASLSVGADIRLWSTDGDGGWELNRETTAAVDLDDASQFRSVVRAAMFNRAVDDVSAGRLPADVPVGLAWLLALDPARPLPWGWGDSDGTEAVVRAAGRMREVISNQEQWRTFRRWALFLGLATESRPRRHSLQSLIPDPTVALADCLREFPRTMSGQDFATRLPTVLPVADNGPLASVLTAYDVRFDARADATIGPAFGYALQRLDRRSRISLRTTDDARGRVTYRWRDRTSTFDVLEVLDPDVGRI